MAAINCIDSAYILTNLSLAVKRLVNKQSLIRLLGLLVAERFYDMC